MPRVKVRGGDHLPRPRSLDRRGRPADRRTRAPHHAERHLPLRGAQVPRFDESGARHVDSQHRERRDNTGDTFRRTFDIDDAILDGNPPFDDGTGEGDLIGGLQRQSGVRVARDASDLAVPGVRPQIHPERVTSR